MKFEWHDNKNRLNYKKHGINFEYAVYVFMDDDRLQFVDNRKNYGEDRYVTIGAIEAQLYTVVYTLRSNIYRLISARKASRYEREAYDIHLKERHEA